MKTHVLIISRTFITIQNTPNSLGQYPADYYLPTTKENLQNFYLFASL